VLKGRKRTAPADAFRKRPPGVPQVLWIADTMHGPAAYGPHRKKHRSFLIALMDDASRAIMAAAFTASDNIRCLMPVLREGILARGLPHRLLVDNGPNYRSRVLRTACARLGIHLVHAAPYRATSKARLERFFRTVRLQMLPRLPEFPSLHQVQVEWARFVAEYHDTAHSSLTEITGTPTTPLAANPAGSHCLRFLPGDVQYLQDLDLQDLFTIEVTRRVNPDATIRLNSQAWEVQPDLVRERVLVRYNPDDLARVAYRPLSNRDAAFAQAFPVQ
jgi:transposase InsO family protein